MAFVASLTHSKYSDHVRGTNFTCTCYLEWQVWVMSILFIITDVDAVINTNGKLLFRILSGSKVIAQIREIHLKKSLITI